MRFCMTQVCLVSLVCVSVFAQAAERKEFNQNIKETDYSFQQMELTLPDYPAADGKWLDLYVSPTYKGKPKILAGSIHILGNNSVAYVLNNQSANNIDNISFENMRCSVQSFRSEYNNGYRQLAFADTYNKRWLESKTAPWRDVGSSLGTNTPVQEMLSRVFCDDGLPRSDKEVEQRLYERGMFEAKQNRALNDD